MTDATNTALLSTIANEQALNHDLSFIWYVLIYLIRTQEKYL